MAKLSSYVVRNGSSRRIVWGSDDNGRYRAKEYFEALDVRQRAKFEPAFTAMAETGKITNPEKFNFEGDGLFCFKIHKHRLACFSDGRDVVIISGFEKKDDRSKKSARELAIAKDLRNDYVQRKKKDT
jgi:hypothetical protein